MAGLALLFPGQASQAVGMGADLRQRSARARALYALADEITGLPITRLCEEGPLDRLTATDVAQPAVVVTSLAALAVLREHIGTALQPRAVAGHSVGEFAAYAAAGALDEESALRLVHVRARAMAAACTSVDGTMAAVIGLDEEPLRAVCQQASDEHGSVEVANLNAPGQLVISGERRAVDRAGELSRAAGARRVLPLNVGGPFHSVYMRPAADELARAVDAANFRRPSVPIVLNVSAQPEAEPSALRRELSAQVSSPVRWTDTLRRLADLGCDRFVEIGPGQVLTGLTRRTLPDARAASFGSLADFAAAESILLPSEE